MVQQFSPPRMSRARSRLSVVRFPREAIARMFWLLARGGGANGGSFMSGAAITERVYQALRGPRLNRSILAG